MKRILAGILLLTLLLSGCAQAEPHRAELFAMDTLMELTVWGEESALDSVKTELRRLDALFSVTDERSEIYALNRDGHAALSEDVAALLRDAVSLSEQTGGAFDPTVYPLVLAWGFTTDTQTVPADAVLENALSHVGTEHLHFSGDTLTLDAGTMLDLGAIAKGYAAEQCAKLLREQGVTAALLSLGGNVQAVGEKPDGSAWVIGIADPNEPSSAIARLEFYGEKALVTSGGYQRYFEQDGTRYHHILDPETGFPAESELASVTVIADSGTRADAYATALFVMGLEQAVDFWRTQGDFEAVFILSDGTLYATEDAASLLRGCEFGVISR